MARLWILAAALCWSTGGIFAKGLDLPGPLMACTRAAFAALCLVPFVPRSAIRFSPQLWVMGIFFALMNVCFVTSTVLTTAANAIALQYTAPAWMLLGSVWLLKEPLDRRSLRSVALSCVGLIVILRATESGQTLGVVLALLSGVAYGVVALYLRLFRTEHPAWLAFFNLSVSALVLLPWVAWTYGPMVTTLPNQSWLLLFLFGGFQMALPYVLFSRGLQEVSPQEAGLIALAELVLNPTLTYFVLGEVPASATLIGGALILAGVALRYVPKLPALRWPERHAHTAYRAS